MQNKFRIFLDNVPQYYLWALDEYDARLTAARQMNVDVSRVAAVQVHLSEDG